MVELRDRLRLLNLASNCKTKESSVVGIDKKLTFWGSKFGKGRSTYIRLLLTTTAVLDKE